MFGQRWVAELPELVEDEDDDDGDGDELVAARAMAAPPHTRDARKGQGHQGLFEAKTHLSDHLLSRFGDDHQ